MKQNIHMKGTFEDAPYNRRFLEKTLLENLEELLAGYKTKQKYLKRKLTQKLFFVAPI